VELNAGVIFDDYKGLNLNFLGKALLKLKHAEVVDSEPFLSNYELKSSDQQLALVHFLIRSFQFVKPF